MPQDVWSPETGERGNKIHHDHCHLARDFCAAPSVKLHASFSLSIAWFSQRPADSFTAKFSPRIFASSMGQMHVDVCAINPDQCLPTMICPAALVSRQYKSPNLPTPTNSKNTVSSPILGYSTRSMNINSLGTKNNLNQRSENRVRCCGCATNRLG